MKRTEITFNFMEIFMIFVCCLTFLVGAIDRMMGLFYIMNLTLCTLILFLIKLREDKQNGNIR